MSTIFPFPSSPHWAPTTTTLAIVVLLLLGKLENVDGKTGRRLGASVPADQIVVTPPLRHRAPHAGGISGEDQPGVVVEGGEVSQIDGQQGWVDPRPDRKFDDPFQVVDRPRRLAVGGRLARPREHP